MSADFDSNGFVSGFDFLLWQRGFGTAAPDAVKTDGDADNDLDADASDLSAWESQFGSAAPIVAPVTAAVSTELSSSALVSQTQLISAEPTDLDLAVELASEVAVANIASSTFVPNSAESSYSTPGPQTQRTHAELVDLALAVKLATEVAVADEEVVVEDEPALFDVVAGTGFSNEDLLPRTLAIRVDELSEASSEKADEANGQWLSDKLLERVFG